ncbi:MAG: hypothetical protein EXR72_20720 [Myxococcales bacterium]|nr:hypothetical protein [Myxococcales bacterium]
MWRRSDGSGSGFARAIAVDAVAALAWVLALGAYHERYRDDGAASHRASAAVVAASSARTIDRTLIGQTFSADPGPVEVFTDEVVVGKAPTQLAR